MSDGWAWVATAVALAARAGQLTEDDLAGWFRRHLAAG